MFNFFKKTESSKISGSPEIPEPVPLKVPETGEIPESKVKEPINLSHYRNKRVDAEIATIKAELIELRKKQGDKMTDEDTKRYREIETRLSELAVAKRPLSEVERERLRELRRMQNDLRVSEAEFSPYTDELLGLVARENIE